jgi:hypothetical protein
MLPYHGNREALLRVAGAFAREQLNADRKHPPAGDIEVCAGYLAEHDKLVQ